MLSSSVWKIILFASGEAKRSSAMPKSSQSSPVIASLSMLSLISGGLIDYIGYYLEFDP